MAVPGSGGYHRSVLLHRVLLSLLCVDAPDAWPALVAKQKEANLVVDRELSGARVRLLAAGRHTRGVQGSFGFLAHSTERSVAWDCVAGLRNFVVVAAESCESIEPTNFALSFRFGTVSELRALPLFERSHSSASSSSIANASGDDCSRVVYGTRKVFRKQKG